MRLSWSHALLLKPQVLFMDEPSAYLDPPGVQDLRRVIRLLQSEGTSVLMSSHNLNEVRLCCDRILLLQGGSLRHLPVSDQTSLDTLEGLFNGVFA